jgi:hypothetical protein
MKLSRPVSKATTTEDPLHTSCRHGDILLLDTRNQRNQGARDDSRGSKSAWDDGNPENPLGRSWCEGSDYRHREEDEGRHGDGEPVVLSGMSHVSARRDRSRRQGNLEDDTR